MQFWNNIVHAALLGTDKKQLTPADLAPDLLTTANGIMEQTVSKEDHFLQMAAVAFNYRQAGFKPLQKEGITISTAIAEEKMYCSTAATQVLRDILEEDSIPLLKYWLQKCQQQNQLIIPELLPVILQAAVTQPSLQPSVQHCAGNRAVWLSQFNADWTFSAAGSNEEIWQTGTLAQRKDIIRQLRLQEPAEALLWIQQTWQQEDAGTKTDLLKILVNNIGENDISFLESLSVEKSKKVKEGAISLLKKIPAAAIVQQYQAALLQLLTIKKEKALLGMISKTTLQILPVAIEETVFKTGIEKLSNNKIFSDHEFIVYQLMQAVPLSYYEKQWQLTPVDIIQLFQKDNTGKKLFAALISSAINFNDGRWAIFLMQHATTTYADLLPLLPPQEQVYYVNKYFTEQPDNIIRYAVQAETEWSLELSISIFTHATSNPYQYNRAFFNQHIHLIPVTMVTAMQYISPATENLTTMWHNISSYVSKLLLLKKQTLNTFNV